MQDDRDAIFGGKGMDVFCPGNSAQNVGAGAAGRFDAFAGVEGSTAVGKLDDDRGFDADSGFQRSVDGVTADAVHGRDGELFFFGDGKDFLYVIAGYDARFYNVENFRHGFFLGLLRNQRSS